MRVIHWTFRVCQTFGVSRSVPKVSERRGQQARLEGEGFYRLARPGGAYEAYLSPLAHLQAD